MYLTHFQVRFSRKRSLDLKDTATKRHQKYDLRDILHIPNNLEMYTSSRIKWTLGISSHFLEIVGKIVRDRIFKDWS